MYILWVPKIGYGSRVILSDPDPNFCRNDKTSFLGLYLFLYCISKSSAPFYTVTYYINWVTTSWTDGITILYS